MQNIITTLSRDTYGSLYQSAATADQDRALYLGAMRLVAQAAAGKKIPAAFDSMEWGRSGRERGKKIGDARHHEIYDINPDGRIVLVCVRDVSGDRYGQKTTGKMYFLVRAHGNGVRVTEANKALAAKAAKANGNSLGAAIEIVCGKSTYKAPANKVRTGYKMVERAESGDLVSVWDKSPWPIGKTRTEAATENHRGGFYYYTTIEEAIEAAAANDTFGDAHQHRRLVVVEVEASGRHFAHDGKVAVKLCASRIRPVREVAMTI